MININYYDTFKTSVKAILDDVFKIRYNSTNINNAILNLYIAEFDEYETAAKIASVLS